ncbi:MAG TPA: fumarylacetoacetate hydrolase family protein [Ilumatobacteraceae bacterium]|nr:fumarylacetoacetate hydrolase family protein [Ilumatobacteraceae bacterium]
MPNLSESDVAAAAQALFQAELDNAPIPPVSQTYPTADIHDAYRISQAVTDLKVAAGRVIKGHKIGLTSKAMRTLTNATEPDYGTLFDDWFILEGSVIPRSTMNRPLVEVELAFVLKAPLRGPAVTVADVIRATDFVLPSIEIVDTRQAGRGPNTLIDSISDAAACGLVILGANPTRLEDIDVRNIGATLSINGDIEESGMARAVMGNPINAVAWLANKLHEYGVTPQEGHTILSGSFIKAIPFKPGDTVEALFNGLGEVTFRAA